MFYDALQPDHGLPHDPFKAIVAPRPIGWISCRDAQGRDNLAPYSFFNGVNSNPPMVMFCSEMRKLGLDEPKDSVSIIRETGVFCVNIVPYALRDQMNASSNHFARGEDEFDQAGIEKGEARHINAPFVAASPAVLECELDRVIDLAGASEMVIGRVLAIHIRDEHIKDGMLDVTSYAPMARLGYRDYAQVAEVFALNRPYQK